MKLLFDENLSIALPQTLADLYPDSAHVFDLGLGGQADLRIWERAAADGFVLVSKDQDFQRLSVLEARRRRWSGFGSVTARQPTLFVCSVFGGNRSRNLLTALTWIFSRSAEIKVWLW